MEPIKTPALAALTGSRKREKFCATWFDDIQDNVVKEWVVDGFLGVGEFTYVVGKPGSGKSVILTDVACHVGAGITWHGRKVRRGLVVYIAAERGALTRRRMMAFRKHHRPDSVALAIIEGTPDFTNGLADANELVNSIRRLAEQCGLPPVLVIIDTLSRSFGGGDQNKSQDMGRFIQAADAIIAGTGAHVTVIHHSPWEQDRAKGAIDLDSAVDASFQVKNKDGRYTLRCDGANDGDPGLVTAFTMESVEIATDEDGKFTTAPVAVWNESLVEADLPDGSIIRLRTPEKPRPVRVFEAALKATGQVNPDTGRTAVHDHVLREYLGREHRASHTTEKSLEASVRRDIATLNKKGVAEKIGEWFYPLAANENIKSSE